MVMWGGGVDKAGGLSFAGKHRDDVGHEYCTHSGRRIDCKYMGMDRANANNFFGGIW